MKETRKEIKILCHMRKIVNLQKILRDRNDFLLLSSNSYGKDLFSKNLTLCGCVASRVYIIPRMDLVSS